ncbi:hypothetical protein L6452_03450 [Arctium lappa]|uniref:Uncharacterized protein n=1 Tax=Arctium lappa TaxID=4217 RepID=A0ACB9FLN1_ARCLA|nr:hypothetical protein L6452_03450 [Arctium lappa]
MINPPKHHLKLGVLIRSMDFHPLEFLLATGCDQKEYVFKHTIGTRRRMSTVELSIMSCSETRKMTEKGQKNPWITERNITAVFIPSSFLTSLT